MTVVHRSSRVSALLRHVDDARQTRQGECVRLLSELAPRLHAARMAERDRDRHLARRFNVFKYLREDEFGLSRIISDLLDPDAEHGQGTKFLEAMLGVFPETRRRFGALRPTGYESDQSNDGALDHDGRPHRHHRGHPFGDGSFLPCMENKPYAHDLPGRKLKGARS